MSARPGPSAKSLARVLGGERIDPPPMWLMRQAGRYLPEYRALRADKGGFLDLVYDAEAAAEVTLQPLRRFAFDGAILFSDILIVPHAIGQSLSFVAGEGPRLAPPLLDGLQNGLQAAPERLDAIYRTVGKVAAALPENTLFLGFAGSPWTVATYMVGGEGSRDQAPARRLAYREPRAFAALIDRIASVTVEYLCGQIEEGVEAVQLFDSWAGSLSPDEFERWAIVPTRAIVDAVRGRHPGVPIIGFPKGAGEKLVRYAEETGIDALGLDETIDPVWAARILPRSLPLQGNLDPLALVTGGEALDTAARRVLDAFAARPHIFNLGHGILQDTPIAHVERLIEIVRGNK